jgi:hypothetical protein
MNDKFMHIYIGVLFSPVSNFAEVVPLIVSQWNISKMWRGKRKKRISCFGDAIKQELNKIQIQFLAFD